MVVYPLNIAAYVINVNQLLCGKIYAPASAGFSCLVGGSFVLSGC
jgi:hypothetical protein